MTLLPVRYPLTDLEMTEEETRMITNGKQSDPLSQDSEVALTSFECNPEDNHHHPHEVILMNPEEDNEEENHVRKKKRKESSSSLLKCSCLKTSSTLSVIALIFISCVILMASSSSSIFGKLWFLSEKNEKKGKFFVPLGINSSADAAWMLFQIFLTQDFVQYMIFVSLC